MNARNIPIVDGVSTSDLKKETLKKYDNIKGQNFTINTVQEIFYYIRTLDQFKMSPLLYFSCILQAVPKPEYIRDFQLEAKISPPIFTLPISLINVIEATILSYIKPYVQIEPINIKFDPFDLEWRNINEFNIFMQLFENYEMDDIRYDHYITIVWNC